MESRKITGSTRFVAILGDPIVQVKTPVAFNAWAAESGLDVVMVPIQVQTSALADTLSAMRGWPSCAGAVVTIPHKQAAATLLDSASERVALTAACNVIRRETDGQLSGEMTDGLGFTNALSKNGFTISGRDARLVGAGGAGSAIALALIDAGIGRLWVSDVDDRRVQSLLMRLDKLRPDASVSSDIPGGFEIGLVCNATPLGMSGNQDHPYPLDDLPANCFVADIVTDPVETPWLIEAKRRNHPIQTGVQMVTGQLPLVTEFLFPNEKIGSGSA